MMDLALGPGEFTLGDKLQPAEYIQDRTEKLQRLYNLDPELARGVISSVYPHSMKRPWGHNKLKERLGVSGLAKAASELARVRPELFRKLASDLISSHFPSVSAAMDAYQQSRDAQNYLNAQQDAQNFPALHATQPAMMMAQQQMAYGSDPSFSAQPVVHHRRRHHRM